MRPACLTVHAEHYCCTGNNSECTGYIGSLSPATVKLMNRSLPAQQARLVNLEESQRSREGLGVDLLYTNLGIGPHSFEPKDFVYVHVIIH